jgi:prepilin-type N-terminal cleavage/methylation domain-containing protein
MKSQAIKSHSKAGFTLLELIVAITILTIAMSIAFQAFNSTIRGWKRGNEVIESIHHGDFAMRQCASALNSMIYFQDERKRYAFRFEKELSSSLPTDWISFVTSSPYFLHPNDPLAEGPHRLQLFIQDDEYGNPALHSISMPALSDEDEFIDEYDPAPYLISRSVQGLEILIYDFENEEWTDKWDFDNRIPKRLLVSFFVTSENEEEESVIYSRVFNIPVAESIDQPLSSPTTASTTTQNNSNGNSRDTTVNVGAPQ